MGKDKIERWAPIPGYDGLYSVSSLGRVMAEARVVRHFSGGPKRLKAKLRVPQMTLQGYMSIMLSKEDQQRHFAVHRLVLMAFVGLPPEKMDACHNDGDRLNNKLENLRWDTRAGNMADVVAAGKSNRGEKSPTAKLTREQVIAIRADSRSATELASSFGVSRSAIQFILQRKRWAHI